jgi:hypothetical protein
LTEKATGMIAGGLLFDEQSAGDVLKPSEG